SDSSEPSDYWGLDSTGEPSPKAKKKSPKVKQTLRKRTLVREPATPISLSGAPRDISTLTMTPVSADTGFVPSLLPSLLKASFDVPYRRAHPRVPRKMSRQGSILPSLPSLIQVPEPSTSSAGSSSNGCPPFLDVPHSLYAGQWVTSSSSRMGVKGGEGASSQETTIPVTAIVIHTHSDKGAEGGGLSGLRCDTSVDGALRGYSVLPPHVVPYSILGMGAGQQ
ncbi:hypothetical protein KIPB_015418, partial [Kipferlia bialata]